MNASPPQLPVDEFAGRPQLLISGLISFLFIGGLLDVSQQIIAFTPWRPPLTDAGRMRLLFWALLAFALFWIAYSLWGLWAVARNETLQQRLATQRLWQKPLLLQVVFFTEHGVLAVIYSLLTGDLNRGVILGLLVLLHIAAAVVFAPLIVRRAVGDGDED